MNVLVIDIGGTNVKLWKTDEAEKTKLPSGKELSPQALLASVREATQGWQIERVSIGYPGEVRNGRPAADAYNLGPGWVDFDFGHELECPVRMMNDACMQALGSYEGGKMLYLGLGTGLGAAFISEGVLIPLALGHFTLWEGESFNHFLSRDGLTLHGKKRWRQAVEETSTILQAAFFADYVVLGGGNTNEVRDLPEGCRRGGNHNAYFGGLRMWDDLNDSATPKLVIVANANSERG